ncbi:interleukin-20 receptor subunit alpha [Thunnus thynnus]|uniref:interleukin-20 receptor subunit alpha n=1 Tax=Thunnus thynnus TaxID=8237 RepID=UPI003527BF41
MWTVFIFLILEALYCKVSSSPPSPINVTFSSVNLWNVVHWFPGHGTPDDTHFTVQYAIYGDRVEGSKGRRVNWRAVQHCTEIVRSWCDLSNETSDLEQGYHAKVRAVGRRASSKWVITRRFDPKSDTTFGPPFLSVEIENNSAIISLKGPMKYLPTNQTPGISMATLYPHMTYYLYIHNTRRDQMHHIPVVSSPYKYHLMEYDTKYCFSAKSRFLSMPVECQSSAWHCITMSRDPVIGQLQRVVVGIVVSSACMCMLLVVGYLLYHYLTGKGQKSPYILDTPSFHSAPLTFPPEKPNLILITVMKDELSSVTDSIISKPACPNKLQLHIADPPPIYTPQRSETPPEPEDLLDDLSVDYGVVGIAETTDGGEGKGGYWRQDGEKDGNNLRGERQKCVARDRNDKKEWRIEDDCPAGGYASQTAFPKKSTHAHVHLQTHTQTERSTLVQAHAWSEVNPVLLTQTQASLQSFQGTSKSEVDREREDRERSGLFVNINPQTGFFHIPLNLSTKWEGGMEGRTDRKIDEGVGEGSESENVPLLCAYASQNIKPMPTPYTGQSHFLSDDHNVLRLASAQEEEEEEEEGAICVNWDPETRKLVLPKMEINKEGGLDGLLQGERGREDRMGGEEEVKTMKDDLRLESVFVRQASEEEAEAQRGMETAWEADDIMTKWNLVISMDQ